MTGKSASGSCVAASASPKRLIAPRTRPRSFASSRSRAYPLLELAARDGAGRGRELPEGADDRAAERVGDDADCGHGRDGEEQEAAAQVVGGRVDLGLRRQRDQGDGGPGLVAQEQVRADGAVRAPVHSRVAGAVLDVGLAAEVAGADDLAFRDEGEAVALLERGVLREPLCQLVAEGQVDDDPSEQAAVGGDDLHLAHAGVRPGALAREELALGREEGAVRDLGGRFEKRRAVALGEGPLNLGRVGQGLGVVASRPR
jgi:hypothetical protein